MNRWPSRWESLRVGLGVLSGLAMVIFGADMLLSELSYPPPEPGWSVEMPVVIEPWPPPGTPR
ncbi:hypothetical protein [Nocardia harenae]|uniref:hypothetical protein n=1 Tax=Nocardia harenae TaxID=358707 RepID=UPI000833263B|nr:hypothetical protein [Nocardia harenae]